jgi:hypothetical protein
MLVMMMTLEIIPTAATPKILSFPMLALLIEKNPSSQQTPCKQTDDVTRLQ